MKNYKRLISLLLVIAIMASYIAISATAAITYDTITSGMMFNQAMAAASKSAVKSIEFKQDSTLTAADTNLTGKYNSIESGSKIHIAYDSTTAAMTVTFKTEKLKLGASGAADLFSYLSKLESIKGLELLDTSSVTSYASMFMGCVALKSLDISTFDFSSIASSDAINQMLNFKGTNTGSAFACMELTIPEIPSNLDLVNQGGLSFPKANSSYSGKWEDASGNTYEDPTQAQSPVSKISAAGTYKWEKISPYGLYVAGIPVTDANKANVLSDSGTATVTYDSTENKLTLNGASINYAKSKTAVGPSVNYVAKPLYAAIEYSGSSSLNIVLSGTNTINTIPMKSDSPATLYYGILSSNSFGKSIDDSEFKFSSLSISGTGTLNFTNNVLDADKANIFDSSSYLAVAAKAKDISIENATITASGYFTNGIVSTNSTTVNDATISSDKISWVLPTGYPIPLNTDALLSSEGTIDIKGVSKISTACNDNTWLSNVVFAIGKITIDLSDGGYVKANSALPIQSMAGVTLGSATYIKTPTNGVIKTDNGYYPSYQATDKEYLYYTEIATKPTYTITFDVDPDSTGEEVTQAVVDGGKINTTKLQSDISSITKTGKHIKEWLISGTTTVVDFATYTVSEAKTFEANWVANTYKVKFDINGGTSGTMSDLDMTYDVAKNLTENGFTRTGYTFAGWATTKTGDVAYADKESVKNLTTTDGETVTLYAKWTPITYKVKFDINGGSSGTVSDQELTYDKAENLTANAFSRWGYTFAGWATSATGDVVYADGASVKNLKDTANDTITLYAKWTPNTYKVRFNANEGTGNMSDLDMTYDVAKNLPANTFIRTGYSFAGWSPIATGNVVCEDGALVNNLTITNGATLDLYAVWSKNSYTVKFDTDSKATVADQTIKYDEKVTKPTDPEATGYTFVAWFKNEGLTTLWDFENDTVTENTTLYAKWTPEDYDITFNLDEGTWAQGYTAPDTYTIEDLVTLPTSTHISREGYTFAGWYDNEDLEGNVITTISKGATGDKEFFAKWTLNTYTVTFDTDDKATVEAQTVNHGELSTQPSDPSASGYVFKGWFEDEDFETPWDFTTPITKDTTIYVKWVKIDADTPKSGDIIVDASALKEIAEKFATYSHDVNSSVLVKATIDENVPQTDKDLLKSKTNKSLKLFNISLLLVMDDGEAIDIGDSNDVLVPITYKFDFTKKINIQTFRVHDSVVEELTETPNEDGEFVKYDKEAGTITVTAMKYSTYSFAYDVVEDAKEDKKDDKKDDAKKENDKKENVANTADNTVFGTFLAMSIFAASGAVISFKKKHD